MKRSVVAVFLLCFVSLYCVGLLAAPRSGHWRALEQDHLKLHPECEACGTRQDLNVHHIRPFHLDPSRELDPTNLITLCRPHHFTVGHDPDGPDGPLKPNWKLENRNVRADAEKLRDKLNPRKKAHRVNAGTNPSIR